MEDVSWWEFFYKLSGNVRLRRLWGEQELCVVNQHLIWHRNASEKFKNVAGEEDVYRTNMWLDEKGKNKLMGPWFSSPGTLHV